MEKKILIIDDDHKLQDLLKEYLEGYGYFISQLLDSVNVLETIAKENPAIVILDIMLPTKDGFEVLKEIRTVSNIPVVMLTAKGDDTDRIIGLEIGADDYLSKPFNPRELLARIKAVLRRSSHEPVKNKMEGIISVADFTLDLLSGTVTMGTDIEELSSTEFNILEALMKSPNSVLTRDDLMNIARGRDFLAFERSIDVHISKLRTKLETLSGQRDIIKTIWGRGYMFVDKP